MIAAGFDDLVLELKRLLGLTVVMVTRSRFVVAHCRSGGSPGRRPGVGTGYDGALAASDDPVISDYFHGPRGRAALLNHAGAAPHRG